jgi:hypothetical protein
MKKNVGGADKAIRILIGLALLSLLFILEGNARWWGLVGLPLLITGITGYCPGYMPFGVSTSKTK